MGDGDPSGSRYYYWADSSGYQSVKLFADVVADVDPQLGVHYAAEAEKYRKDILRRMVKKLGRCVSIAHK